MWRKPVDERVMEAQEEYGMAGGMIHLFLNQLETLKLITNATNEEIMLHHLTKFDERWV